MDADDFECYEDEQDLDETEEPRDNVYNESDPSDTIKELDENLTTKSDDEDNNSNSTYEEIVSWFPMDEKWYKPRFDKNEGTAFDFYLHDIEPSSYYDKTEKIPKSRLILHGIADNNSVVSVKIDDYYANFMVLMDWKFKNTHRSVDNFIIKIKELSKDNPVGKSLRYDCIVKHETRKLVNGYNYYKDPEDFLVIYTTLPTNIPVLRGIIEYLGLQTYESNVPYVIRAMIDKSIKGCGWIRLNNWKYSYSKQTINSADIDAKYDDLEVYSVDKMYKIPQIRVLSFDIECAGREGHFPKPDNDPIVLISTHIGDMGKTKYSMKKGLDGKDIKGTGELSDIISVLFVLSSNETLDIKDNVVFTFKNETDLLKAFISYVIQTQTEILTGYNIRGFDMEYIYLRCLALGVNDVKKIGRYLDKELIYRSNKEEKNEETQDSKKKNDSTKMKDLRKSYKDALESLQKGQTKLSFSGTNHLKIEKMDLEVKSKKVKQKRKIEIDYGKQTDLFGNKITAPIDNPVKKQKKETKIVSTEPNDSMQPEEAKNKKKWAPRPKQYIISGISIYDIYDYIKSNFTWKKECHKKTLDEVSGVIIGKQKADVHWSVISTLAIGTEEKDPDDPTKTILKKSTKEQQEILAKYCVLDAIYPLEIAWKTNAIGESIGMSRVSGVPFSIVNDGQSMKIYSLILCAFKEEGYAVPTLKKGFSKNWSGAKVFNPKTGYYKDAVATLDFASLYPSIMIAHNLCYTTHVPVNQIHKFKENDYFKTPWGAYFVKPHIRKGILPKILEYLLAKRKEVRIQEESEKDPFEKSIKNAIQNALKILANSLYGFTGFLEGLLPMLAISASVTSFGQKYITMTKDFIENKYKKSNQYSCDCEVIYGDTDSVMVLMKGLSVKDAHNLMRKISEDIKVAKLFPEPMSLTPEKIYLNKILDTKKKYVALKYDKPDEKPKPDAKGIALVRGDTLPFTKKVQQLIVNEAVINGNTDGLLEKVSMMCCDFVNGKEKITMGIISNVLKKEYDKYGNVPFAQVVKNWPYDQATRPGPGDRVPYTLVNIPNATKNTKVSEMAQHPEYAVEKNMEINWMALYENKVKNPIKGILSKIFDTSLVDEYMDKVKPAVIKKPKIDLNNSLLKYVSLVNKCISCEKNINDNSKIICNDCSDEMVKYKKDLQESVELLKNEKDKMLKTCISCQGKIGIYELIKCSNTSCKDDIYYDRYIVDNKLKDEMKKLSLLENQLNK